LAYKALDKLADSSQVWDFTSYWDKSARAPKKGGIYELKGETEMNMNIDVLTKRLDALSTGPSINAAHTYTVDSCSIYASPMHLAQNCPSTPVYSEYLMEQVNTFNDYQKQSNGHFSKTYNPRWRNHQNFSWKQNQGGAHQNATNQYPPRFHTQQQNQPFSQVPTSSSPSALEETIKTFIQSNGQLMQELQKSTMINSQAIQEVKNATMVNTQAIANIESQIGQIANHLGQRKKGTFPSQPVPNPKALTTENSSNSTHRHEQVQSIATLRSGRQVDNRVGQEEKDRVEPQGKESGGDKGGKVEPTRAIPNIQDPQRSFVPKAPYLERLRASKKNAQFAKILEVFKQV
jgi:hypothetical protein